MAGVNTLHRGAIPKDNQKKIGSFRRKAFAGLGVACLSVAAAASNLWNVHLWDKEVTKYVEIAANVPSVASDDPTQLSMQTSLQQAKEHLGISPLPNPAIVWKTPATEVKVLDDLLQKAVLRARDIYQLQQSFAQGKLPEESSLWVREAYQRLHLETTLATLSEQQRNALLPLLPSLEEVAGSEYGQRIGSEYENLNSVVAGGTRTSGKNLKEKHHSLLDTLQKASNWRAWVDPSISSDDYMQSWGHVFVGYLLANMGYLDESLQHIRQAKKLMDLYPDEQNLSVWRNTPELEQRTIKGLLASTLTELEILQKDPHKYSTGWWKRLRYYNQSIGGQANPSIQDMAESIGGKYLMRAGLFLLPFGAGIFFGGRYALRYRKAKQYQVVADDLSRDRKKA